jgi:hypothetical protein
MAISLAVEVMVVIGIMAVRRIDTGDAIVAEAAEVAGITETAHEARVMRVADPARTEWLRSARMNRGPVDANA